MATLAETHLGDGVYATMTDFGDIVLDLRGQDSTTRIVLEPRTFEALLTFARSHTPVPPGPDPDANEF